MFFWNWLISKRVRQATELKQQAKKVLHHQRDLLTPEAIEQVKSAIEEVKQTTHAESIDPKALQSSMTALEAVAGKWLRPYPNPSFRENIEVFLVAGAVALAVRTFFFQPMAIPTGSAQPTFWGIEHTDYREQEEVQLPTGLRKWYLSWIKGEKYYHVVARASGQIRVPDLKPKRVLLFIKKQVFYVGDEKYTLWFPPDQLFDDINRSGLSRHDAFEKGEDIIKLKVTSGDHLFVNRMIYNFRKPKRGETIVFASSGLEVEGLLTNTHYIKRLVAMDGDRVRIGDDRHLVVNGRRLDASDPGFEWVYAFDPSESPGENEYAGHAHEAAMRRLGRGGNAPYFPDASTEYQVRPNHYLVLGDNTFNSNDSRFWGDVPREKTIGRASFLFWPITERFGWHQH